MLEPELVAEPDQSTAGDNEAAAGHLSSIFGRSVTRAESIVEWRR